MASTGVIAEPLDVKLIENAIPDLVAALTDPSPEAWEAAATAIGTTDTFPKGAAAPVEGTDAHRGRFRQRQRHDRPRHGHHAGVHLY